MIGDKESDFWKRKINDFQHRNMTRAGAERLNLADVNSEIEKFEKTHPDLGAKTTDNGTYITWEFLITSNVKLRLFFQSQIKLSLMDISAGDAVKICDVKCFYNPFPEVDFFVSQIPEYKKELEILLKGEMELSKKQQIAGEFIKAYLKSKISTEKYLWQLLPEEQAFKLHLTDAKTFVEKNVILTFKDFMTEINKLQ